MGMQLDYDSAREIDWIRKATNAARRRLGITERPYQSAFKFLGGTSKARQIGLNYDNETRGINKKEIGRRQI